MYFLFLNFNFFFKFSLPFFLKKLVVCPKNFYLNLFTGIYKVFYIFKFSKLIKQFFYFYFLLSFVCNKKLELGIINLCSNKAVFFFKNWLFFYYSAFVFFCEKQMLFNGLFSNFKITKFFLIKNKLKFFNAIPTLLITFSINSQLYKELKKKKIYSINFINSFGSFFNYKLTKNSLLLPANLYNANSIYFNICFFNFAFLLGKFCVY